MKKTFILISALLAILGMSSCSNDSSPNTQPELPKLSEYNIDSVADFMFESLKLCHPKMKDVWPNDENLDPANFNMILVDSSLDNPEDKIYYITPAGKNTISANDIKGPDGTSVFNDAITNIKASSWVPVLYDNKPAMMIDIYYSPEKLELLEKFKVTLSDQKKAYERLELFYHEVFHKVVQINWGNPVAQSREQSWPVDNNPRTYRMLCYLALVDANDKPSSKDACYKRAKYWLNKYETDYAEEAKNIKDTDISEGTANYFGKAVVNSVYKDAELFERYSEIFLASTIDGESYSLGSTAINLLKRDGKLPGAIENTFKKDAKTPVQLLLEDVTLPEGYNCEEEDKTNKEAIEEAQGTIYATDGEDSKLIDATIESYKNGGNTFIAVFSSFSSSRSFALSKLPGFKIYLNLEISTEDIQVTDVTALNCEFTLPTEDPYKPQVLDLYLIKLDSVSFTSVTTGLNDIPMHSKASEIGNLTGVESGKITAITPISRENVTLNTGATTKTCYKGNTIYIVPSNPSAGQ